MKGIRKFHYVICVIMLLILSVGITHTMSNRITITASLSSQGGGGSIIFPTGTSSSLITPQSNASKNVYTVTMFSQSEQIIAGSGLVADTSSAKNEVTGTNIFTWDERPASNILCCIGICILKRVPYKLGCKPSRVTG